MPRGIGREIARRVLDRTDGGKGKVVIRIGQPVRTGEDEWKCPYAISGIGLHGFRRAFGVDALQSLMLAIEGVRVALTPHRAALTWLEGEPGSIGITMSAPYSYSVALTDRIERLIERETLRHGNAVRRRSLARRRTRIATGRTNPRQVD